MIEDVVRLALACGAAQTGGPLSRAEMALIERCGSTKASRGRTISPAMRAGGDPLGEMYCELLSTDQRRRRGAFYTGSAIVDAMLDWALDSDPERVVDAGCGSGRFAAAIARREPGVEILAIDADPVATLMTRASLAAIGARRARVLHADYLFVPIARASGRTAFVGNPPYVRHHDLSPAVKARAAELAAALGIELSGLAGLHALFYLATLAEHAREGDVGSFVTSAEWLDVGYGAAVREAFAGALGGESLALFDARATPFSDAMTTAVISTFRIGRTTNPARFSRVAAGASALVLGGGRAVDRGVLTRAPRWSALFDNDAEQRPGSSIGSFFRVSRGQVTGANGFFVMSRAQAEQRGLARFCVPLIVSAREIFEAHGVVRDGPQRLVGLSIPPKTDLAQEDALARYVREGELARLHTRYVASRRRPWYAIDFPRPPIVATYMARQAPSFARNPDRLGLINVAHGLYPRDGLDDTALERIVTWLNAARPSFIGRGRTYHGGLEKFEPREMENLPLEVPA